MLCNLFIVVSPNIVTRNLVSFTWFFACVVILFSEESLLRGFLQLKISSVLHLLLVYSLASYS